MKTFVFILLSISFSFAQTVKVPEYYKTDSSLNNKLQQIAADLGIAGDFNAGEDGVEQISLAVIDFSNGQPVIGGVHLDNFIYPASFYKVYVAAAVLKQVSEGKYSLNKYIAVTSPNCVDRSKEIKNDPRPLLKEGDTVTVNYLLDLMITRSDNSAANFLIDLAKRENINEMMHQYGWQGSEVTRKYLSRKNEDPGYEKIRGTETCALHAADFMYRVYTNQLVNPWVSMQLKCLLGRQLDQTKLAAGLPANAMFYHKTGWFSFWTNDSGIVDDGKTKYVISCLLPLTEEQAVPKMKILSQKIYELMRK
ncbi:MAG: serine hydrolase [Bacteroidota bacterium]|nr:serine hydrolase [Bacteroidota bacterium]